MAAGRLVGRALRLAKRAGRGKTTRAPKPKTRSTPPEALETPVASGGDSTAPSISRLRQWGPLGASVGMAYLAKSLFDRGEKPPRKDLQTFLKQLQSDTDTASTVAVEEIAGLDRLMLMEREVASQAPPGAPPATPILDRLRVVMPDLLTQLRQRMKGASGGLWSELAEGEILVDGASAPSRAQVAAEDQQLEVTLREELGFSPPHGASGGPRDGRDAQALLSGTGDGTPQFV